MFHDHRPKDDYEVGRVETRCLSTHYKDLNKQKQKRWSHYMINVSREAGTVEKYVDSSEVKYELLILEPKTIIHNICTANVFSDQPSKQALSHTDAACLSSSASVRQFSRNLYRLRTLPPPEVMLRTSPAVKLTVFRVEVSKCYFQLLRRPKNLEPIFLSIRRRAFLGIPAISLRVRSFNTRNECKLFIWTPPSSVHHK